MLNHSEKNLWTLFSKFIRFRDADERGYCHCISCSTIKKWNDGMEAGHYEAVGADRALKYNEVNVNAQCTSCNRYKSGNLINYRRGLILKYGEDIVKKLETSHWFKTTKKKLGQGEINVMYLFYKNKVKELEKEKNLYEDFN